MGIEWPSARSGRRLTGRQQQQSFQRSLGSMIGTSGVRAEQIREKEPRFHHLVLYSRGQWGQWYEPKICSRKCVVGHLGWARLLAPGCWTTHGMVALNHLNALVSHQTVAVVRAPPAIRVADFEQLLQACWVLAIAGSARACSTVCTVCHRCLAPRPALGGSFTPSTESKLSWNEM